MSEENRPRGRRFGPSHTGNRRGRPRGARNVKTIVETFARKKHKIKENGRPCVVTTMELLFRLTAQLSIDHVEADKLIERYRKRLAPSIPDGVGVIFVPEAPRLEEWIRRAEIENRFRKPPENA